MRVVGFRAAIVSFAAFVIFLAGCDKSDEQIKVYRVAKAPIDSTPREDSAMPTNVASPKSLPEATPITTKTAAVPPNWEPQPLSQMRQASFLVHGDNGAAADVSFVTLGVAAGNVLDNVNRWLAQLAQPPITPDKLASTVQKIPMARGEVDVVDLVGQPENGDASKDGRIVAAMSSEDGKISFFKMRGNPALVGAQKDNFVKWVSSVLGSTGGASGADSEKNSDKRQIKWEVPAGWSPAPSSMRYASFSASDGNGGKIDISVVTFPGDGGSDADNVNRWRQQIGLPPIDGSAVTSQIAPLKTANTNFSTTDIAGANARTIAAWTRRDGRVWFFKATGPNAAVEKEKPTFVKFIESVRF